MEGFNQKLEVGQLAMIIGCFQPKNAHAIGTIVTVEEMPNEGDDVSHHYDLKGDKVVIRNKGQCVYVSGCKVTSKTSPPIYNAKPGIANFQPQYLMPLPPLEEKEVQKEQELELA